MAEVKICVSGFKLLSHIELKSVIHCDQRISSCSMWQDTRLPLDLVTQQCRLQSHDMFLLPLQQSPWQPCLQLPPATGQTQNSKTKKRIPHSLQTRVFCLHSVSPHRKHSMPLKKKNVWRRKNTCSHAQSQMSGLWQRFPDLNPSLLSTL